jgi:hypothetical protein
MAAQDPLTQHVYVRLMFEDCNELRDHHLQCWCSHRERWLNTA